MRKHPHMNTNLLEAQMHAECMNEALLEYFHGYPRKPSVERKKVIEEELKARVWAVIYLIQFHGDSKFTEDAKEAIKLANAFNGPADEFDVPVFGKH